MTNADSEVDDYGDEGDGVDHYKLTITITLIIGDGSVVVVVIAFLFLLSVLVGELLFVDDEDFYLYVKYFRTYPQQLGVSSEPYGLVVRIAIKTDFTGFYQYVISV